MINKEIETQLSATMERLPELGDFGIGLFDEDYKKPKAEQQAIYEQYRVNLCNRIGEVEATIDWLRKNVQPTKTINKRRTSYGMKHVVERDIGYITNGVFIAAGIIAGYPYKISSGSPNVEFGMSEKSFKDVFRRRANP